MRILVRALKLLLFSFLTYVIFPFSSWADNELDLAPDPNPDPGFVAGNSGFNVFATLLQVILVLIVIIGLIVLLIYFLSHKNKSWMSNRSVRLLGGLPLGQNKSLQIVEVGQSIYLIGVGDNVQLIEKIDDQEQVEQIINSLVSQQAYAGALLPIITKWLQPRRKSASLRRDIVDEQETDDSDSFQQIFQSQMKGIANRKTMISQLMKEDTRADRSDKL